jgi:hypothetical protein
MRDTDNETEEREVKDELEGAPIEAPAPEVKEEEPIKESKPQLVLHKFEKAAEKEFTFSGQDLAIFLAGILALTLAAYFYGRASVEIASE